MALDSNSKERLLELLICLKEICDRNRITYWLDGGTLLGAVRHKGFIPWDDDIDVGVMRKDYSRLIDILKIELPDNLFLQTVDTDPCYNLPFAKIRDKLTNNSHTFESSYAYNGLFIDIFPFDAVPNNSMIRLYQYLVAKVYEYKFVYPVKYLFKKKKLFRNCSLLCVYTAINFLPGSFIKNLYNAIVKYNSRIDQSNIGDGMAIAAFYYKSIRVHNVYFPVGTIKFENVDFSSPANPDVYLRSLYGNSYMTPDRSLHETHFTSY